MVFQVVLVCLFFLAISGALYLIIKGWLRMTGRRVYKNIYNVPDNQLGKAHIIQGFGLLISLVGGLSDYLNDTGMVPFFIGQGLFMGTFFWLYYLEKQNNKSKES